MALVVPVLEIHYNIYLRDQYNSLEEETQSERRFLKPKKRPKGSKSKTVVLETGPIAIDVEDIQLQVLRICYVCLILMGFLKVLYVA